MKTIEKKSLASWSCLLCCLFSCGTEGGNPNRQDPPLSNPVGNDESPPPVESGAPASQIPACDLVVEVSASERPSTFKVEFHGPEGDVPKSANGLPMNLMPVFKKNTQEDKIDTKKQDTDRTMALADPLPEPGLWDLVVNFSDASGIEKERLYCQATFTVPDFGHGNAEVLIKIRGPKPAASLK